MKHDPSATTKAAAATTAIIYVVCAGAFILFPELAMAIAQSWFHGIDLSSPTAANVTAGSLVLGIVTASVGGWLVGWIFASTYNYFLKK